MNKDYQLPSQKDEAKRSRNEVEIEYGLFSMNDQLEELGKNKKYYIRTYGCQANVRDGESIAGMMEVMGFTNTEDTAEADVLIFNTCAVRRAAEEHVLGEIGMLKGLKNENPDRIFCVCGCMAQEESVVQEILKSYPQVDLIFGTHNIYRLPDLLKEVMTTKKRKVEVLSEEGRIIENLPVKRTQNVKGYVDIMYGCNKFCTYCIVPYTRGKERSRRMSDIIREVKQLIQNGGKEVILLGQNVNAYGKDLGMDDGFTDLLIAVAETGIERIRFYSSSPRDYSESTIQAMLDHPNIMPALHLPVQSGSNEVLRRMARGYTVEQYKEVFDRLKSKIPNITFTTDLIVGFPQETDEEFRDTIALVDYCKFDGAFSFMYSPREGTPAARMDGQIDAAVKKERLHELNEHINHWAKENNQKYLHKTVKVLCEGRSKKNAAVYSGYSEENKLVNFTGQEGLENQIVEVEITEVRSFSLNGKAL
ncbi:tRNA (N6-isopentenyl adenosine(37)-C2)-methylthiotransferase MiaB [Erysipelotrichaceae bacterium]|jgi:tRNA-2-methylthio-N6-dimethylallyladenosine synthase|uniref:tRNA (N6-isopentenyl adenosine(37)-C2)-methylthiotransferase MiaB n=1 Tax=unclassified Bulleidia TaxID=2704656 RepID=UPI0015B4D83E|nr:tRNA (N6-isopentenyl adenosine(37)-C2)-methylthiotransferase MiaB [Erysipelotrichaceae bacterium 7770_A6]MCI7725314.1 tRNA (N6-isopentenyl adenosine(37)-C2)-methylthiotransferase MiaB [Erysipelotrichaceae bacterium]MDD7058172.1 tRNA (N6-isopentenyl adenosine(37)-C2)-methylthiotransferase MiaB [Erysipelotrichaceae bacterium]MDY3661020.1 tRNA (N6-isopentenyl adenosine(37)-C2)-methylthiotransferase MiaB [Bulleidia sp.]MEE0558668.1 tRNA (N6-isopentenyl adenosine(37)-C2)-methylthiotransferase Mia